MGLDAVVYKGRRSLPFIPEEVGAILEPKTGEFYFADSKIEKRFNSEGVIATSKRLGNASTIGSLSEVVELALRRDKSILQDKVLFSGTHSGDVIEPTDFVQLRAELDEVRGSSPHNKVPILAEFVLNMEDLLDAALKESNPIVFT